MTRAAPELATRPRLLKRPAPATRALAPIPEGRGYGVEAVLAMPGGPVRPAAAGKLPAAKKRGVGKSNVPVPRLQAWVGAPVPSLLTVPARGADRNALLAFTPASHPSAVAVPQASMVLGAAVVPAVVTAARGASANSFMNVDVAVKSAGKPRAKASEIDAAEVRTKVAEKAATGKLVDLTVMEAKCWLKEHKLPLKGKKEDLIARIQERLG